MQKTAGLNYSPQFLRVSLSKGILQVVPSSFPDFFLSYSAHSDFLLSPEQHPASVPCHRITITVFPAHVDKPLTTFQRVNAQRVLVGLYLLAESLTWVLSRNLFSTEHFI